MGLNGILINSGAWREQSWTQNTRKMIRHAESSAWRAEGENSRGMALRSPVSHRAVNLNRKLDPNHHEVITLVGDFGAEG